ncbi:MAG: hypothetical protein ACW98F_00640 [Candidatus Hodarchaeales archaeon]|jgi:hypothetical protein
MPRILTLQLRDVKIPVTLRKFSRESLYGRGVIQKRGEGNIIYKNALITQDGIHILPSKAIASQYIDPQENFVDKTLLVDAQGKELPLFPSMFKQPVTLSKTINLNDFFNYGVEMSYVLASVQKESLNVLYKACNDLLKQNKLYRFTYAYYETTSKRDVILIPHEEQVFALVGNYAEPVFLGPNQILYNEIDEQELVEEIAFEVW